MLQISYITMLSLAESGEKLHSLFLSCEAWISFEINNSLPGPSCILRTLLSLSFHHPDPQTAAQARFWGGLSFPLHPLCPLCTDTCLLAPSCPFASLFLSWDLKLSQKMKKGRGSSIPIHQSKYWFLPPTAYFLLEKGGELAFNLYKIQLVEVSKSGSWRLLNAYLCSKN